MDAAGGDRQARRGMWAALALEFALLCGASRFGDFTISGTVAKFVALVLPAGAVYLALLAFLRIRKFQPSPVAFWIGAVALRLAMWNTAPADDFWRYVWEGRIQLEGFNPYVFGPTAPELAPFRDEVWQRINHPESAAIYPPATELVFAGIAAISTSPFILKLVFVGADLLTALVLVRLTGSCRTAAWYAWNPAVIYAFAGGGHSDSLMLLPMTAAMWALHRATADTSRPANWNWSLLSAALLALAIAFKVVPIFLVPAWMCALRGRSWVLGLTFVIPVALTSLYGGLRTVMQPLQAFTDVTRFNDLFWWLVEAITLPNPFQRNWPFMLALGVAVLLAAIRFRDDWRRCALWCLGLALVFSPVFHPWYAVWILPLACWRRAHLWSVLSISVLSAFLLWETTRWWSAWQANLLTRALVLLPPLIAWRFQVVMRRSPVPAT